MLMAHRTGHAGVIAVTARFVVIADLIFTATAVVVQPVTGFALARAIGLSPLDEPWMVLSILIYIFVGLCWLPVVFIQMRMRKLANDAAVNGKPLPLSTGSCSASGSRSAGRLSPASSPFSR